MVKKPKKAVDAVHQEFFLLVAEAHILPAAMMLFGIAGIECEPTSLQHFPVDSQKLASPERKQVLLIASGARVDKYVVLSMEKAEKTSDSSTGEVSGHDGVVEYASEVLTFGLLLMEFDDAIREGDGNRIRRCWQYFLLIFKVPGRKNYSIEALTLLAQLNFFFCPRMAAQLT